MKMSLSYLLLAVAPFAFGCTSTYVAPVVKLADMKEVAPALERGEAVWVEFEPGEEFPFFVSADGALFETRGAPLTVRVKKRFFVLLGDGMPKLSYDGVHVADLPPGSFGVGFGVSKEVGPHATARVTVAPEDGPTTAGTP